MGPINILSIKYYYKVAVGDIAIFVVAILPNMIVSISSQRISGIGWSISVWYKKIVGR